MDEGLDLQARAGSRCREAVEWFVRHESDDMLSQVALEEWHQWTAQTENCLEFDSVVRLRREVLSLPRPSLPAGDELRDDLLDEPKGSLAAATPVESDGRIVLSRFHRRWFSVAAAAGVLVVLACVTLLLLLRWRAPMEDPMNPGQVYATARGEQREVALADGSSITLAGNTAVVVRLTASTRTVLLSRGEALFHVKKDAARPFTVFAKGGRVTALGTVFDIRRYSNRVHVAVTEGAVEVAPQGAPLESAAVERAVWRETPQWTPVRVAHGQQMSYDDRGDASAPRRADTRIATAWTRGALIYDGRPLREIVEDVQRYSTRRIAFDPAAGELQYTGTVLQGSIEQWIHGLPEIFPVEIIDSADGQVLIRARPTLPSMRAPKFMVTQ